LFIPKINWKKLNEIRLISLVYPPPILNRVLVYYIQSISYPSKWKPKYI